MRVRLTQEHYVFRWEPVGSEFDVITCTKCASPDHYAVASDPDRSIDFRACELIEDSAPSVALRYDDGKIDFTLIPVDAQEAEAQVWAMGEKKYGRDNWQKLWGADSRVKIMKSLLRHAFAILRGEDLDAESGLPHAAHIRCNCAMLIRDYENRKAAK